MPWRDRALSWSVGALAATALAVAPPSAAPVARAEIATSTECAADTSTPALNSLLAHQLGDVPGFDSPVTIALPGNRVLWLVQDAFVAPDAAIEVPNLRPPIGFAHNVAIVQEGRCFTTIHAPLVPNEEGVAVNAEYLGQELTDNGNRWFWPMGGAIDADGRVAVFVAEMRNPNGTGAAAGAAIEAVWLARIDAWTFDVLSFTPAPDPAARIAFGHWVDSDQTHSYLFGSSRDQFNLPDATSPSPSELYVARVPLGRFDLAPEYWNGSAWVTDRAGARPVFDAAGDAANPMQPRRFGATWVSVVKVGDWAGATVRVDTAPAPEGPWTTVQTLTVPTRTLDGRTNTYAAHLMPWRSAQGNLVIALSNNAWFMEPVAFDDARIYRPTLFELQAPPGLDAAPAPTPLSDPLAFVPRAMPGRALDTRQTTRLVAFQRRVVDLAAEVEPGARAAVVNLTLVTPDAGAFLTAWPCDQPQPATSNVNAAAGAIRAAHAVVSLAADGTICLVTNVAADAVVDVSGSYVPPDRTSALDFHPQAPQRLYDSRTQGRALRAGETRRITTPAGAEAIAANVTVTDPTADGFVTVYPCAARRPVVSNVNMVTGQVVANLVEVGTSAGEVCVYTLKPTHVVIDLVGTFDRAPGGYRYQPVTPTRLTDTRTGQGTVFGRVGLDGGWAANAPVALSAVPSEARAIMTSMIAVSPVWHGWGLIAPCQDLSAGVSYGSSTLNFTAGDVVANQSIVATPSATGAPVCTFTLVPAHHVVDLVGWFV